MELLGSTIGGRYRLDRLLSDGGMSVVFEGTDLLLNRVIAVKVLHRRLTADPAFLARFWQEAQAAAAVSHPGIVEIYDFGQHDGTNFIVLELIRGMPLNELLARDGPLLPARAARIAAGVCDALEAAHRRGLIHRDIKPGNIMVRPGDSVKIMDFGLARAAEVSPGLTDPGMVVGTALYLSPEQVMGQRADARSDIYAVGVCLYELLSGERPFPGATPAEIAMQHVKATPRPLDQIRPELPSALVAAVHQAIAKRPEDRQPSAAALRESVEDAVGIPASRPQHRPDDRASSDGLAPPPSVRSIGARAGRRRERAHLVHGVAGRVGPSAQGADHPRQARRRWVAAAALGLFIGAAGAGTVQSVWDEPVEPSIGAARPNQVQTPTTSPEHERGGPATPPQQGEGGQPDTQKATKPKDDGGGSQTTQASPSGDSTSGGSTSGDSSSGGSSSGGSSSGGSSSGGSSSGGSSSGGSGPSSSGGSSSGGSSSDGSSGSLTDLVDPLLDPITDPLLGP